MDIDYAELYGLKPGEKDFTGVIERLKKRDNPIKHLDKEYLEVKQWMDERRKSKDPEVRKALKDKINNFYYTHKECCEILHKNDNVHNETQQLILEYNRRLKDDINYPNKDNVRRWFDIKSQELIDKGAPSFSFLYPEFMGSIEDLEKIYNISYNKNK